MSDVPIRELKRLQKRFESQSRIFPEDSQSRRVCEWAEEQVTEVVEEYNQ